MQFAVVVMVYEIARRAGAIKGFMVWWWPVLYVAGWFVDVWLKHRPKGKPSMLDKLDAFLEPVFGMLGL